MSIPTSPHHAISCPYKMTGFLPSTYKMGWRCGSLFFFFSNMQLKTLDCSKLFGFLTPIMWFLPNKKPTHTQRTTWLLANLFPHGFESWDVKMQRTFLWFYSLQSGFLMHFGLTTKWVSWNWSRKSDFSDCSGPLRAIFFVYKLGLITCKNSLWRQSWWKKYNSNPVLTSFRYSFCSEKNRLRSGIL